MVGVDHVTLYDSNQGSPIHQQTLAPVLGLDPTQITVYAAGLGTAAKDAAAAKALVKALTGPDAAAVIRKHGMEPG